jgi:hypothetical protein
MEIIDMNSKKLLFAVSLLLVLVAACSASPTTEVNGIPDPLPCGEEVEWDLAVKILNQGNVEQVAQLHSLEVTLILEGGCEIQTIEPSIDDIFDEVQKCGEKCEGMILATE